MKKILTILALLAVVAVPMLASAQTPSKGQCTINQTNIDRIGNIGNPLTECRTICNFETSSDTNYQANCGMCCMLNTVYTVTDWFFFFITIVAIIMILIGGFTFITASGSPEKAMAARSYLIYAAIGIAVGLLARVIPSVVKMITGVA